MKDAVLVLGMGGPDGPEAVKPFLQNLLSDREIIDFGIGRMPQKLLAAFIAKRRSRASIPKYGLMGNGSPQLMHTEAMLKALAPEYTKLTGRELDTYVGMCYWRPYIEDTVAEMNKHAYGTIYLLPMYPQYSTTTSGAGFNRYNRAIALRPPEGIIVRINSFYNHKLYLDLCAARIHAATERLGKPITDLHLLFSAHSLPRTVADSGDPYEEQVMTQVKLLTEMLKPASASLAFQSKLGRRAWLEPMLTKELARLAASGVKEIVIFPVSFINDHIETLVELDVELREDAQKLGVTMIRADTFNGAPDFAAFAAGLLAGA